MGVTHVIGIISARHFLVNDKCGVPTLGVYGALTTHTIGIMRSSPTRSASTTRSPHTRPLLWLEAVGVDLGYGMTVSSPE